MNRTTVSGGHLRRRWLMRPTLAVLVAVGLWGAAPSADAQRRVGAAPPFDWATTDTSCTSASDSVDCTVRSQSDVDGSIRASAGVAPSAGAGEGTAYSAGTMGTTILVPKVDAGVRRVLATVDVRSAEAWGPPVLAGGWGLADVELCVRSNKGIGCLATTTVRIADSVIGSPAPAAVGGDDEGGPTVACRLSLVATLPEEYRPQQVVVTVSGMAWGAIGGHAVGGVGERTLDAAIDEAASDMPAPWVAGGRLDVALTGIQTNPSEIPATTCTVDEVPR